MYKVIHYVPSWLNFSHTFIYEQIRRINGDYSVGVITCQMLKDSERFKFDNIASMDQLSFPLNWFDRMSFRVIHHSGLFHTLLKGVEPDIFHIHFGTSALRFMKMLRRVSCPLVVSFYGKDVSLFEKMYEQDPQSLFELWDRGARFIALSNYMKQRLIDIGCPEEKIRILDVGIDVSKFHYVKRQKNKNILTIARFVEKKGIKYLIEAMKLLPDVKLTIIGDGPLNNELRKDIPSNVEFLGIKPYNELHDYYRKANVFVLASCHAPDGDFDEMSQVLKEAAATGMNIVTTNHAGIPELFDNEAGVLVEEKNPKALAEGIKAMLKRNPSNPKAREWVLREFDADKQVKKLEQIYGELV